MSNNALSGPPARDLFAELRNNVSKSPSVRCFSIHTYDHDHQARRLMLDRIVGLLADGSIRPAIARKFKLADVRQAHALLERGEGLRQDRDEPLGRFPGCASLHKNV